MVPARRLAFVVVARSKATKQSRIPGDKRGSYARNDEARFTADASDGGLRHANLVLSYCVAQVGSAVIARSKATKQSRIHAHKRELLRCARNDEARFTGRHESIPHDLSSPLLGAFAAPAAVTAAVFSDAVGLFWAALLSSDFH